MRSLIPPVTLAAATLLLAIGASGQSALIPRGSDWRYNATGVPGIGWQGLAFDDGAWPAGAAPLGYGDADEETVIPVSPVNPPVTIYFRRTFEVANVALINRVTLRVAADDGAVVYLNGAEVARRNLPSGIVGPTSSAISNLETNENYFAQYGVFPSRLRTGTNVISVEVHQHPQGRQDCSFDLELLANLPAEPPSITILSPTNDAVVGPGPISLQVLATDSDGHISRVMYLTNGVPAGESVVEPFTLIWTNPAVGHYRVVARAYDNYSNVTNSPPIHLQVGLGARPQLFRGPYLQSGSSTGMTVRWRTDWYADSVVRYGREPGIFDQIRVVGSLELEHEIAIEGLVPDTTYYYAVGSAAETFVSGASFRFHTSPTNAQPTRIWVIGDSGTADQSAMDVRDAYRAATAGARTDLWLMLGDNVYGDAQDNDFSAAVFDMYRDLLSQSVVWPAIGNHEANDISPGGDVSVHSDNFSLPTQGEAGGVASGTELYYSFDYANIHFVCLDSFVSQNSTNGPMVTWLRSDLAATDKDWIIAYWHHPPYSWGTHNSDDDFFLSDMREHVVPVLEAYGVDLVLSGHSHNYERSFLINGHYGPSATLQPTMILDGSSGGGTQPYRKPAGGLGANRGTVYAVCGCSGQGGLGEGFALHPAMALNHGGFGSMILQVDGLKLTARFLRPSLAVDDFFVIDKSGPATIAPELQIERMRNDALVSWPTSLPPFRLEAANSLRALQWAPVLSSIDTVGRRNFLRVGCTETNRFFRLREVP